MGGVMRYRGVKSLRRRRGTPSDAELLQHTRRDPSAFSELYTRHVGDVHGWLSRRIAWAGDLTAETFARALLSIDRFRDDHDGSALPWSLERFGDHLDRAAHRELATPSETVRERVRRPRPRLFAGGTLGLAGVGAAVLLALGGSAATAPAYAITQKDNGTVLVKFNFGRHSDFVHADQQLTAKYHEEILVSTAPGPATVKGPLNCVVTRVPGVPLRPGHR
jgi:hypothetical protein